MKFVLIATVVLAWLLSSWSSSSASSYTESNWSTASDFFSVRRMRMKRQTYRLSKAACEKIKASSTVYRTMQAATALVLGLDPEGFNSGVYRDLSSYQTGSLGMAKNLIFRDTSTGNNMQASLEDVVETALDMCCFCEPCAKCPNRSPLVQSDEATVCDWNRCRITYTNKYQTENPCICNRAEWDRERILFTEKQSQQDTDIQRITEQVQLLIRGVEDKLTAIHRQMEELLKAPHDAIMNTKLHSLESKLDNWISTLTLSGQTALSLDISKCPNCQCSECPNCQCPECPDCQCLDTLTAEHRDLLDSTKQFLDSTPSQSQIKDVLAKIKEMTTTSPSWMVQCLALKCPESNCSFTQQPEALQQEQPEVLSNQNYQYLNAAVSGEDDKVADKAEKKKIKTRLVEEQQVRKEEKKKNLVCECGNSTEDVFDKLLRSASSRDLQAVLKQFLDEIGFQSPTVAVAIELIFFTLLMISTFFLVLYFRFRGEIRSLYKRHEVDLRVMNGRSKQARLKILMWWFSLLRALLTAGLFYWQSPVKRLLDEDKKVRFETEATAVEARIRIQSDDDDHDDNNDDEEHAHQQQQQQQQQEETAAQLKVIALEAHAAKVRAELLAQAQELARAHQQLQQSQSGGGGISNENVALENVMQQTFWPSPSAAPEEFRIRHVLDSDPFFSTLRPTPTSIPLHQSTPKESTKKMTDSGIEFSGTKSGDFSSNSGGQFDSQQQFGSLDRQTRQRLSSDTDAWTTAHSAASSTRLSSSEGVKEGGEGDEEEEEGLEEELEELGVSALRLKKKKVKKSVTSASSTKKKR